jgi:hypothetical protein
MIQLSSIVGSGKRIGESIAPDDPPRCEVVHISLGISAHLTAMAAVGVSGLAF